MASEIYLETLRSHLRDSGHTRSDKEDVFPLTDSKEIEIHERTTDKCTNWYSHLVKLSSRIF